MAVLDRIPVASEISLTPGSAKEAIRDGRFDLVIASYESEGCGLPLAVGIQSSTGPAQPPDCIVVADKMCPTLALAAKDLGLLAVLVRPVAPRMLAAAIETHVAGKIDRHGMSARSKAIA